MGEESDRTPGCEGTSVLVVVHDDELAEQVCRALRAAGHDPVRMPAAARSSLQHGAVVLELADAGGLAHVSALLGDGDRALVALTSDDELGLRALALGAQDYLPPYDAGLVGTLRRALVRRAHDAGRVVSARDQLAREHALLEASQDAGRVGSWELDLATMVTEWSAGNARLHGLAPTARRLSMSEMRAYVHPDDQAVLVWSVGERKEFTTEYRVVTDPRDVRVLVSRGAWRPGEDGHPGYLVGTSHDVTAERAARHAQEVADEQFRRAFETGVVAMAIADRGFRLLRVNDALCDFFDRPRAELLGRSMADLADPADRDGHRELLERLSSGAETSAVGQRRYLLPGGDVVWGEVGISAVRLAGPEGAVEYVVQLRDVTATRTHEQALRALADQDPLTSVLNRRGFDRLLQRHLDRDGGGAVLMLDLDGFKGYNDAFGHPAGDVLLVEIAHALREHLRSHDALARLGGDEFVVLLPGADRAAIGTVAPRLVAAVREVSQRMAPQQERAVTASVGVAEIPAGRPADVLHRADEALYAAKAGGRDTWVLADPS